LFFLPPSHLPVSRSFLAFQGVSMSTLANRTFRCLPLCPYSTIQFLSSFFPNETALENARCIASITNIRFDRTKSFSTSTWRTDARSFRIQSSCRSITLRPRPESFFSSSHSRNSYPFSLPRSIQLLTTSPHYD